MLALIATFLNSIHMSTQIILSSSKQPYDYTLHQLYSFKISKANSLFQDSKMSKFAFAKAKYSERISQNI